VGHELSPTVQGRFEPQLDKMSIFILQKDDRDGVGGSRLVQLGRRSK
jgi:hypothetical protein